MKIGYPMTITKDITPGIEAPATGCGESPIVRENVYFIFAHFPLCKQRGMRSLFNAIPQ